MVSKKKDQVNPNMQAVESALTRTEMFVEDNSKIISYIIIGVFIIVGGFIGIKKLVIAPKQSEAASQMFMAEQYFEKDSFNLALNGDGNYLGFLDIIDEYKITKAGKLANYYAGICYLNLGQYEEAIESLSNFNLNDVIVRPIAMGAMGDAYVELEDLESAVSAYNKAAGYNDNQFTSPIYLMKAGQIHELLDQPQKALAAYQRIKDDYPDSAEARQIDKYIERVKNKA